MTTTEKQGWEERFSELPIAVAYKQNGAEIIDFDYFKNQMEEIVKPFISQEIENAKREGRKDLAREISIAMELTKAQGYEDFSNRVFQLVDGLESLEEAALQGEVTT